MRYEIAARLQQVLIPARTVADAFSDFDCDAFLFGAVVAKHMASQMEDRLIQNL